MARGLDVNAIAPRISFFFNAHNDFFEEIAKYRAARRIWATYSAGCSAIYSAGCAAAGGKAIGAPTCAIPWI